ncbi:MAG: hypothetical protein FP826_01520 [Sphingomonadales bacterium]|nr:hypothetical protein [Sphingomonadales bacterium]MBU3993742.1 hypothetical protein [Alphaproteobacteria bacterium]
MNASPPHSRASVPVAPLVERLRLCAQLWTDHNAATLARLGRTVINDGGYFARIDSPEASTTTATLEKFARFLGDGANWPDGLVPEAVRDFVHVVGVCPDPAMPSPDTSPANIAASGDHDRAVPEPASGRAPAAVALPPSAAGAFVSGTFRSDEKGRG